MNIKVCVVPCSIFHEIQSVCYLLNEDGSLISETLDNNYLPSKQAKEICGKILKVHPSFITLQGLSPRVIETELYLPFHTLVPSDTELKVDNIGWRQLPTNPEEINVQYEIISESIQKV